MWSWRSRRAAIPIPIPRCSTRPSRLAARSWRGRWRTSRPRCAPTRRRPRSPPRDARPSPLELTAVSEVRRAVLVGGTEDYGGPGGDAAQGADLVQQILQRDRGRDPHLEDVVLVSGDAVAGFDRGEMFQPLGQVIRGGGVERLDRHESGQRQPDVFRVEHRGVALDDAVLLEPADPLVHGRHREPGLPAQLGEAHPPVTCQQRHDLAIDLLHVVTLAPWPYHGDITT